ncbi:HPr family phosphocarrier protein [Clostridium thermosuccinogenes]|jgi:phosphotransferase system HPr (HPr) family protein|uniref:HPr family phosphocarrier protein n=1 Tax=Clostridium thermosuccinogenes TaxID=84032 RepID=A0A2K2F931_9CLOT|nr:HPr family phosphocarrier protein [Pseudoclostridium thermosuccinogenes]AUS98066.1 HPr family phosphocarrier protein [Pseudoclostridium thermosuccinogenes]PNT91246.1 HPr family phosphocarrier protein [Pseudoclostridium thermosuccinogenes]PNT95268.1 HPr family phosphocarrier protein [Pseudoclostridium thermosuccinogenes]PNT96298.1 HPr family phosphocarrier protein [Pseudoclostridium thermosuccinogenes]
MITREITLTGRQGLVSKPAAIFIQKASNYKSSIWIEKNERRVNAKSLLGLLSLGIENGNKVTIIAEGEDEQFAVNELEEYLKAIDQT